MLYLAFHFLIGAGFVSLRDFNRLLIYSSSLFSVAALIHSAGLGTSCQSCIFTTREIKYAAAANGRVTIDNVMINAFFIFFHSLLLNFFCFLLALSCLQICNYPGNIPCYCLFCLLYIFRVGRFRHIRFYTPILQNF